METDQSESGQGPQSPSDVTSSSTTWSWSMLKPIEQSIAQEAVYLLLVLSDRAVAHVAVALLAGVLERSDKRTITFVVDGYSVAVRRLEE